MKKNFGLEVKKQKINPFKISVEFYYIESNFELNFELNYLIIII